MGPLDLADLSFDLSQLPELPLDANTPDSGTGQDSFMEDVMNEHMDVDMDVADWLETLPPDNRKTTPYSLLDGSSSSHSGPLAHSGGRTTTSSNNINLDQLLNSPFLN